MLSIVDIKKELGKNIYIYPLNTNSIKSNSVDLRASRFAWSLNTKHSIYQDGQIIIPNHDTALIYTQESIYVSRRIGGTYHSKVTLVAKGLGHISTTLDAQYIGNSIIAIHNTSDNDVQINEGDEFITLQFWYLHTADYYQAQTHDNFPGHPSILDGYYDVKEFTDWQDKNLWTKRKDVLLNVMKDSDEYKQCKADLKREINEFGRFKINRWLLLVCILAVILVLLCTPAYFIACGSISSVAKTIVEKIYCPLVVAILATIITLRIKGQTK